MSWGVTTVLLNGSGAEMGHAVQPRAAQQTVQKYKHKVVTGTVLQQLPAANKSLTQESTRK